MGSPPLLTIVCGDRKTWLFHHAHSIWQTLLGENGMSQSQRDVEKNTLAGTWYYYHFHLDIRGAIQKGVSRIATNILNILFSSWQVLSWKITLIQQMLKDDSFFLSAWQELYEAQMPQILTKAFSISLPALLMGKKASGIPHSLWNILNNSNTFHHHVAICSQSQRTRFISVQGVNAGSISIMIKEWQNDSDW